MTRANDPIEAASYHALPNDIDTLITHALKEDVGGGDITGQLIPPDKFARAQLRARELATLCGTAWFDGVFAQLDPRVTVNWNLADGDGMSPNQVLCELKGPARAILTGERTALNLLQTLSSTATTTRRYVREIEGTAAKLLDTRKTIPGMRLAQKYAVRCGGGTNHRMGLFDGILIKENHIAAAGSIAAAVAQIRALYPSILVEVEVEDLAELDLALEAKADIIMLDNFELKGIREAVTRVNGGAKIEASGGLGIAGIRDIAEAGVDFISVGALTKNVSAVDFSLRVVDE